MEQEKVNCSGQPLMVSHHWSDGNGEKAFNHSFFNVCIIPQVPFNIVNTDAFEKQSSHFFTAAHRSFLTNFPSLSEMVLSRDSEFNICSYDDILDN